VRATVNWDYVEAYTAPGFYGAGPYILRKGTVVDLGPSLNVTTTKPAGGPTAIPFVRVQLLPTQTTVLAQPAEISTKAGQGLYQMVPAPTGYLWIRRYTTKGEENLALPPPPPVATTPAGAGPTHRGHPAIVTAPTPALAGIPWWAALGLGLVTAGASYALGRAAKRA
jgi:hypothetical protein